MIPRNLLRSLALAPCLTLVSAAQEPKPRLAQDLSTPQDPQAAVEYKVGDVVKTPEHRTRWDYPKEFTLQPGFTLHFVVTGDTLWDLGQRYLGNPYAWPQIWEHNKWIKDPHWIFPGDPLLVPSQNKALAKATDAPESTAPPEVASMAPETLSSYRRPLSAEFAFSFQDFLQLPYIVSEGAEAHIKGLAGIRISGGEKAEQTNFSDGDKIFLDGGQDTGVKVGDRRLILKPLRKRIFHPDDTQKVKPLGDVVKQIGIARIVHTTAKGSIAVIERCLDGVERGHALVPYTEPASIPLVLRKDTGDPVPPSTLQAKVVHIGDSVSNVADGSQVIIDRGAQQGLKIGDMLLMVLEDNWSIGNPRDRVRPKEQTFRYIGQAIVVHTNPNTSTCRIVRAKDSVQMGTRMFK